MGSRTLIAAAMVLTLLFSTLAVSTAHAQPAIPHGHADYVLETWVAILGACGGPYNMSGGGSEYVCLNGQQQPPWPSTTYSEDCDAGFGWTDMGHPSPDIANVSEDCLEWDQSNCPSANCVFASADNATSDYVWDQYLYTSLKETCGGGVWSFVVDSSGQPLQSANHWYNNNYDFLSTQEGYFTCGNTSGHAYNIFSVHQFTYLSAYSPVTEYTCSNPSTTGTEYTYDGTATNC